MSVTPEKKGVIFENLFVILEDCNRSASRQTLHNLEDYINMAVECPICLENIELPVKFTACSHYYCLQCARKSFENDKREERAPKCPLCRHKVTGWRYCPIEELRERSESPRPLVIDEEGDSRETRNTREAPSIAETVDENQDAPQDLRTQSSGSSQSVVIVEERLNPRVPIRIVSTFGRGRNTRYALEWSDGSVTLELTVTLEINYPVILETFRRNRRAQNTANCRARRSA